MSEDRVLHRFAVTNLWDGRFQIDSVWTEDQGLGHAHAPQIEQQEVVGFVDLPARLCELGEAIAWYATA